MIQLADNVDVFRKFVCRENRNGFLNNHVDVLRFEVQFVGTCVVHELMHDGVEPVRFFNDHVQKIFLLFGGSL